MTLPTNSVRRLFAAGATAGLVAIGGTLGVFVPQAMAHDSVIGGSVVQGEVLDEFPEVVTLEFSGIPKEGFNSFAVMDTDVEEVLFTQEPELNERELSITPPDDVVLGDGNYQVGFQITSSDGHATRGRVRFSVEGSGIENPRTAGGQDGAGSKGSGTEPEGELNSAENGSEGLSTTMTWILAVGGVLAVGAVLALLVAKNRMNIDELDEEEKEDFNND